ncbi:MAG: T9SS type A sorting domain-containing protein [Bacteroidota bacterium]|nr:T9SS type A sorting domain-containing protein [Bacteroidota bacterium]
MKKVVLSCLLIIIGAVGVSAQNYVNNYSFENDSACPNTYNQVTHCYGWKRSLNNNVPQYHTEYLHACGTPNFSVPTNTWGYQVAATGQAYMATCTMAPNVQPNYRENIYTNLITPLQVGASYTVSLQVSFTDNSQHASNNFGVKFATTPNFPVNNLCQLYSSTVINDKQNWITISGTFIADSSYSYIAIGNFFTDANTTVSLDCPSCSFNLHGYFVDDICVLENSTGSALNSATGNCAIEVTPQWISTGNQMVPGFSVYPNVVRNLEELQINYSGITDGSTPVFHLFDVAGKEVVNVQVSYSGTAVRFTGACINPGVYFMQMETNKYTATEKIVIVN